MAFRRIDELENLSGKRVLLRLDLNVPVEKGAVVDDFRIVKSLKTVNHLTERGARVLIISHIKNKEGSTLEPVVDVLRKHGVHVTFIADIEHANAIAAAPTSVILFENLRNYPGEEANDPEFAKKLAALGDIYVSDAFSVCHRDHASVVGVPKLLESYAGFQLSNEIDMLSHLFVPAEPFVVILGGAKFETKLPLLKKFYDKAQCIYVAGALSNDFFKALGYEVGTSTVSATAEVQPYINDPKVMIPKDVVVTDGTHHHIVAANAVQPHESIMDIGPISLEEIEQCVSDARTILWNGPLGFYEKSFPEGTDAITHLLAEHPLAETIVGGGDTVASISKLRLEDKFTFVSTGGGAMLQFLADETLPGITALEQSVKKSEEPAAPVDQSPFLY